MFRRAKVDEREKLDKEVQQFLLDGGKIDVVPAGQSNWDDNYSKKDLNRHLFKRAQAAKEQ